MTRLLKPKALKSLKRFLTPYPIISKKLKAAEAYEANKATEAFKRKQELDTRRGEASSKKWDLIWEEGNAKREAERKARAELALVYDLRMQYLNSLEFIDKLHLYSNSRAIALLRNAMNLKNGYLPLKYFGLEIGEVPVFDMPTKPTGDDSYYWQQEFNRVLGNLKILDFLNAIGYKSEKLVGPESNEVFESLLPDPLSLVSQLKHKSKKRLLPYVRSAKRAKDLNAFLRKLDSDNSSFSDIKYELDSDPTSDTYGLYVPMYRTTLAEGPIVGTKTGDVKMPDPITNTIEEGNVTYIPGGSITTRYTTKLKPDGSGDPKVETLTSTTDDGQLSVSDNYVRALRNMLKYIYDLSGGTTYDYGSAVGVSQLGLPHITHDADVFIIDSDFNRLVNEGKIPNPLSYRGGRTYKADLFGGKYRNAELFGTDSYGVPNNPGMVDFNIIETDPTTGHAVGYNASEILRLFYPELYQLALNEWFTAGRPLTNNGFKDIKTGMTPLQLMSKYSPEMKTLLDLLEIDAMASNKGKQLGRDYNYIATAPTDVLNKAIQMHAKAFVGNNVLLPPDLTSLFLDYNRNVAILQSLGIDGLDIGRIAKDPLRMLAIFNLNYLRKSTLGRATDLAPYDITRNYGLDQSDIDAYASLFADGLNRSVGNAKKFLTRWNSGEFTNPATGKTILVGNNGENMGGTMNAVEMGDSRSFKDIYGFMLFGLPQFASTPEEILALLDYNTGRYPVTAEQATAINDLFAKYFPTRSNPANPIIKEGQAPWEMVSNIPSNQGDAVANFYDEVGKLLNIQGIITSPYSDATRFGFPLLKDWEPQSMHYGYGNTGLYYRQSGSLRDPVPNSITIRNQMIRNRKRKPDLHAGHFLATRFGDNSMSKLLNLRRYINNPNVDAGIPANNLREIDILFEPIFRKYRDALKHKAYRDGEHTVDEAVKVVTDAYDKLIAELNNILNQTDAQIDAYDKAGHKAYSNLWNLRLKREQSDNNYADRLFIGSLLGGVGGLITYAVYRSNKDERRLRDFLHLYPDTKYTREDFFTPNPAYRSDSAYWYGPYYNHETKTLDKRGGDWSSWDEDRKYYDEELNELKNKRIRSSLNRLKWLDGWATNQYNPANFINPIFNK